MAVTDGSNRWQVATEKRLLRDLEVPRMETRQDMGQDATDARQDARQQERSLGELFGDLTRDMSALIRQETQLATTEMTQKAARAGKSAGVLAGGALIAYAGFFALLWAIVYGLTNLFGWPIWVELPRRRDHRARDRRRHGVARL